MVLKNMNSVVTKKRVSSNSSISVSGASTANSSKASYPLSPSSCGKRSQSQRRKHQSLSRRPTPPKGVTKRQPPSVQKRRSKSQPPPLHSRGDSNGRAITQSLSSSPMSKATTPRNSDRKSAVKTAIDDLNKAIGHDGRIAAITNACEEFDHWDENRHNLELKLGTASVLSLVLSMTDDDDEIRMVCAALEMVFRASQDVVKSSFFLVGSAVVPLLLRLLERSESGNMRNADVSIMNISKVLLYFSRVQQIRIPLARHQGLLSALTRVATSILNADSRVVRMRVIANLANADENKVIMYEHTGFIGSVLRVANLDLADNAREYASAVLMDLASAPLNQAPMARNDKLLATLVKLCVIDDIPETREYAVTALQNLAFAKENRKRLTTFGAGVVLEALKKTVSSDPNYRARRRAAGALTNLACDETAQRIGSHRGLLNVLSVVSMKDGNEDVQRRAALALTKIASSITVSMQCHAQLLDALVVSASGKNLSSAAVVFRAKAKNLQNRSCMARHSGCIEALAKITSSHHARSKDKENAMRAMMHLTNDDSNKKMMACKTVLDALVKGASMNGQENENTRDSAITAMERLATESSNRKLMARHEGLLVAIAKATEREAKAEKKAIDKGQERLAKPLLMSLLLAM